MDVVLGNVLAMPADLLVLPTTALGTLGDPWSTFLQSLGVDLPIPGTTLGRLVMLELPKSRYVRRVAVAATVAAAGAPAEPSVIGRLAEQIGAVTHEYGIDDVLTPALGAGAGNLAPEVALEALVDGFVQAAAPGARLHVVVASRVEQELLERRLQELAGEVPEARPEVQEEAPPVPEPVVPASAPQTKAAQTKIRPPSDASAPPPEPASARPAEPVETSTGRTKLVHDQPARADLLGRASLATEVASLLRELAEAPDRAEEAFAVHLDAPWGAGKSSLVGFIGERLSTPEDPTQRAWTVIELDAWRSSQLSPAWWAVLGHLREGVRASLSPSRRIGFSVRRFFAAARRLWRIWLPPAVVLAVLVAVWLMQGDPRATMTVLTGVVAFTVAIGGLGSKFLSLGSLQGARVHERLNENPMEEVAEQIWAIRRESPKDVLLVLDDLDRCNERFAVELLDAVQTLLRRGPERSTRRSRRRAAAGAEPMPALVVLAVGDGRWLRAAYEDAYRVFSPYVSEPGRPLGHLFLDKLFQLRIELPTLNRTQVSGYLAGLLDVAPKGGSGSAVADELLARIREAPQEAGPGSLDERMVDLLTEARGLGDTTRQGLAEAVLEARRTNPERARQQSHILEEFAELLEPNPRATKRFLMAYNVAFAARLTELEPLEPKTLALWTVVATRWPALAEWIRGELPDGDLAPVDEPGHPSGLLLDPQVRTVVGSDRGGPLDRARVLRCCGYVSEARVSPPAPLP